MAAPKGNRFWEARASHGRHLIFETPDILWSQCLEYFEWVEENPLYETKVFQYQGEIVRAEIPKMRAMTIDGLCMFLDVARRTWDEYRAREDFLPVIEKAEKAIYQQKFSGAAADFLNANIIARDLGLTEKREETGTLTVHISGKDADL